MGSLEAYLCAVHIFQLMGVALSVTVLSKRYCPVKVARQRRLDRVTEVFSNSRQIRIQEILSKG